MINIEAFPDELVGIMKLSSAIKIPSRYIRPSPKVRGLLGIKRNAGPSSSSNIFEAASQAAENSPKIKALRARNKALGDQIREEADSGDARFKAKLTEHKERLRKMKEQYGVK